MSDESPSSRWLTRRAAVKFLGVSQWKFGELRKLGMVKRYHLVGGDRGKYDREELRKLLEPQKSEVAK
jgi:hypothetical protein